jgi:hypothetical protein
MANAGEWVRQTVASAQAEPLPTEAVWKSLERHIGQGDKALARARDVLDYIDQQLLERKDGPAMRGLWHTVADYLEKMQENMAAA